MSHADRPNRRPRRLEAYEEEAVEAEDKPSKLAGIIPYKNVLALLAYYCGFFSLIAGLGALLGQVATTSVASTLIGKAPNTSQPMALWIACVGAALGPAAVILGILGLRHVNRHREAKGTGHAFTGIVLGFLATLGNAAVLLLMFGRDLK